MIIMLSRNQSVPFAVLGLYLVEHIAKCKERKKTLKESHEIRGGIMRSAGTFGIEEKIGKLTWESVNRFKTTHQCEKIEVSLSPYAVEKLENDLSLW